MKKVLFLFALLTACIGMQAQYTQTLPLNYSDFFRADAIAEAGDSLERGQYTNTSGVSILADQWNRTGKATEQAESNPVVQNNTLSYSIYIDNARGKEILLANLPLDADDNTQTRASIYSLKNTFTYSGQAYYLAALVNITEATGKGDILAFDGNYTSNSQRGRLFVNKQGAGYKLGLGWTNEDPTWTGELAFGSTHLVVMKVIPAGNVKEGTEEAAVWVDPDLSKSEAENTPLATLSDQVLGLKSIRGITIRQRSKIAGKIAGLRFGASWADVVKSAPTASETRIVTDFADGTWGDIHSGAYTSGSYPTATINGLELADAGMQDGSVYAPTGARITNRISMDKLTEGGMITLPAVTSLDQIVVYASSGSADKDITLQQYDYSKVAWKTIDTWHFATTDCYRFSTTVNSDEVTRLRIVNANNNTKYIWKIATYATAPTVLATPTALDAANISAHAFSARWNAVADAEGYRVVVYNVSDGKVKKSQEAGADVTSLNITGLDATTDYTYKVAAIGDDLATLASYLSEAIEVSTAAEITDTYTRTVTNGNFGTICLPKACEDLGSAGGVFFAVAGKIMQDTQLQEVVLDEVMSLEAGKPYVFQATASELNIPLTGAAVAEPDNSSSNGLKGSFTVKAVTSSANNYILSNNMLYCTEGQSYYVGENRAYFDVSAMPLFSGAAPAKGARRVRMSVEGQQVLTGMEDTFMAPTATKHIIDGQVVIMRNGVRYDLTGRRIQ